MLERLFALCLAGGSEPASRPTVVAPAVLGLTGGSPAAGNPLSSAVHLRPRAIDGRLQSCQRFPTVTATFAPVAKDFGPARRLSDHLADPVAVFDPLVLDDSQRSPRRSSVLLVEPKLGQTYPPRGSSRNS